MPNTIHIRAVHLFDQTLNLGVFRRWAENVEAYRANSRFHTVPVTRNVVPSTKKDNVGFR